MYCMYLGLYPGWYYCWVPHLHCCLCNKSDTQQWAVSNKTKKKKCKEGFIQSVGKLQTLICSAILPINLKQRESGPLDHFLGFFQHLFKKVLFTTSRSISSLCGMWFWMLYQNARQCPALLLFLIPTTWAKVIIKDPFSKRNIYL